MSRRFIDADKIDFRNTVVGQDENAGWDTVAFKSDIDAIPTADVVEVVRCKDCKHCKKESHWKELYCLKMSDDEHTHWIDKDFYCGYGERREE